MDDLKVCWWPIGRPTPYARNSRKIPERAIDKVASSIKEFGWRVPIVVDKDGVVICGHTRLLAAKKLGLQHVPVHVDRPHGESWSRVPTLRSSHVIRAPAGKSAVRRAVENTKRSTG